MLGPGSLRPQFGIESKARIQLVDGPRRYFDAVEILAAKCIQSRYRGEPLPRFLTFDVFVGLFALASDRYQTAERLVEVLSSDDIDRILTIEATVLLGSPIKA
jgi:hypothetical protein